MVSQGVGNRDQREPDNRDELDLKIGTVMDSPSRLLIDGHLDLAWNVASFDRDLTLNLSTLNATESSMTDVHFRGNATVTFEEMKKAGILLCLGTLLARSGPQHRRQSRYARTDLDFAHRIGAYAAAHAQRACYNQWENEGHIRVIRTQADLASHWSEWCHSTVEGNKPDFPIGVVLSMEGADPIVGPNQLAEWYELGLRVIGPAHYGESHYAQGTATDGPINDSGRQLLAEMERLGMALDVTHLSDQSMAEALDSFGGVVWASHHNCRSLVPGDRQLTDDQIQRLVSRNAVIGVACDAWMLQPNWKIGETTAESLTMESLADHIDHVCQLAGSANYSGIGSDLDGGFGNEQTPSDLKSIADLQRLAEILSRRGYHDDDVDKIFYGNWLRIIEASLPTDDSEKANRDAC